MSSTPRRKIVEQLLAPEPETTEATIQSRIAALLTYGDLNLSDDQVRLETPTKDGTRRRIDIEVGRLAIEVKRDLRAAPLARRDAHNLTSAFTQYSNGNPPRADRLRNTWFTHHLRAGTPMKDLFQAAGLTKLAHLPQLLEHVEVSDMDRYQRLLRSAGQT